MQLAQLVRLVPPVQRVRPAQPGQKAPLAQPAQPARPDLVENRAFRACRVFRDRQESPVRRGQWDQLGQPVHREQQDHRARWDRPERPAQLVRRDLPAIRHSLWHLPITTTLLYLEMGY